MNTRNNSSSSGIFKAPSTSTTWTSTLPPSTLSASSAAVMNTSIHPATTNLLDCTIVKNCVTTTTHDDPSEPDPAITIGPPDFYPPTAAASSSSQQRRRPLSPRLDYGLWFEGSSFMRLVDPPLDIVPYLGEGMYTLAGRINWACTEYLVGVCRRVAAASPLSACSITGRSIDPEAALRGCAEIRRSKFHGLACTRDIYPVFLLPGPFFTFLISSVAAAAAGSYRQNSI